MTGFQHLSPLGIHSLPFHPTCGGIEYPRTRASQAPPFRHVPAPLYAQAPPGQERGWLVVAAPARACVALVHDQQRSLANCWA